VEEGHIALERLKLFLNPSSIRPTLVEEGHIALERLKLEKEHKERIKRMRWKKATSRLSD